MEIVARHKLPSRCLFYGDEFKDIEVEYRAMTTVEQELMMRPEQERYDKIEQVLKNCLITKLDVNKLLVSDQIALLFFIRSLTYGSEYNTNHICDACGEKMVQSVDLSKDLPIKYLDDDAKEVEDGFELSNGKVYGLRRMTVEDQKDILEHRKKKINQNKVDDSLTYRLAKSIVSVDGKEVNLLEALAEFPMSAKDSTGLTQALDDIDCGIKIELESKCKSCGHLNEFTLNLDQEFFRPSTVSYKRRKSV